MSQVDASEQVQYFTAKSGFLKIGGAVAFASVIELCLDPASTAGINIEIEHIHLDKEPGLQK